MTASTQRHPMSSAWAMTLLLFAFGTFQVSAQNKNYTPGQKIEYMSWSYPETWEEATFISYSQDGTQPIIKQKPSQYQPNGFQRAATFATIRPLAAPQPPPGPVAPRQPPPPPVVAPRPPPPPAIEQPEPVEDDEPLEDDEPRADDEPAEDDEPLADDEPAANNDFGAGLMSKADVAAVLAQLGANPIQNPRRAQVKQQLAEMIKARGLNFRFSVTDQDFWSKLSKVGATTDITFPLGDNYGPPTKRSELVGIWNLGKIGAPVDFVVNDELWRQNEIGVANVGALRINANGTYGWLSKGDAVVNGRWRAATPAEMRSKGGDGIVLLDAKTGYDWIVTKNRTTTLGGKWIDISELGTRQVNEYGSRP